MEFRRILKNSHVTIWKIVKAHDVRVEFRGKSERSRMFEKVVEVSIQRISIDV
jgi:hypothetical protein